MRASIGGGFIFRFFISVMTAILVVSTLSLALGMVSGASRAGSATGKVMQANPGTAATYLAIEAVIGILTFVWSYKFVLGKRKK
jgi:hypothetical protein